MIGVKFVILAALLLCIGVVMAILRYSYYSRKYEDTSSDDDEARRFLWEWFPDFHYSSPEEFFLFLKWWFILLFWVSLIYAVFFKIPIPFVGKPLLYIEGLP